MINNYSLNMFYNVYIHFIIKEDIILSSERLQIA